MIPPILLLPSELKHHIVAELSSPESLAALARTHTAYRDVAEQALYHTLSILSSKDDSLKCMKTLATNPKKAALVRFLTIEPALNNIDRNRETMAHLLTGLINMRSLSDCRIRMRRGEIKGPMIKVLHNILCDSKDSFRLKTLYCNDFLDIPRIIKSQTELQILGLYSTCTGRNLVKTLKVLHNAQFPLPIILTLDREGFLPVFNHITIFPAFYSIDRRTAIPQVLLQSLGKDRGSSVRADANKIWDLSIYLMDSSDMPSIHALVKEMAINFPHINWICFLTEAQFTVSPEEKKKILSLSSDLREVEFYQWPGH